MRVERVRAAVLVDAVIAGRRDLAAVRSERLAVVVGASIVGAVPATGRRGPLTHRLLRSEALLALRRERRPAGGDRWDARDRLAEGALLARPDRLVVPVGPP